MAIGAAPVPDELEAVKALLASALARADEAEAKLANAEAKASATDALHNRTASYGPQ